MANMRKDKKGRGLHTGEQQRKDGIYLYRYTDVAGKRRTVYAGDLPELRQKEKQIQRDLDNEVLSDISIKNITLNELFAEYMKTKVLANTSRINYTQAWECRIRDEIGYYKVAQLRPAHIKAFYKHMVDKGYRNGTIRSTQTVLYPVLEMAVENDIIRKNPAKKAYTSNYGSGAKEKQILTLRQQELLFDFLKNSNVYQIYIPMFEILLEIGLRYGELAGLTWNDISFEDKVLSVNHQLIYKNYGDGCRLHGAPPKTKAGIREIPLTDKVLDAFRRQNELNRILGRYCKDEIDGYTNFVFLSRLSRPYTPGRIDTLMYGISNAYNKQEMELADAQHRKPELLPKFSVHDLRHTACTNKARQGMNAKALQYMMGHSSSKVTLEVYNHLDNVCDLRDELLKCAAQS